MFPSMSYANKTRPKQNRQKRGVYTSHSVQGRHVPVILFSFHRIWQKIYYKMVWYVDRNDMSARTWFEASMTTMAAKRQLIISECYTALVRHHEKKYWGTEEKKWPRHTFSRQRAKTNWNGHNIFYKKAHILKSLFCIPEWSLKLISVEIWIYKYEQLNAESMSTKENKLNRMKWFSE